MAGKGRKLSYFDVPGALERWFVEIPRMMGNHKKLWISKNYVGIHFEALVLCLNVCFEMSEESDFRQVFLQHCGEVSNSIGLSRPRLLHMPRQRMRRLGKAPIWN